MEIEINKNSGFCFGVVNAIGKAEQELSAEDKLYCLGDIVHNNIEIQRLEKKGLVTIDHEKLKNLKDCSVLIRAHGEPPSTYLTAIENNISLIDSSCPIVLRLQKKIRNEFEKIHKKEGQIVIFGKKGHAEVNGLVGQTGNTAIVISSLNDLSLIDYSRPIRLFSQTTQNIDIYTKIQEEIKKNLLTDNSDFIAFNTICKQIAHRKPALIAFAKKHDAIVFVSGRKSSNGKYLYSICKESNKNTYFISDPSELDIEKIKNYTSIGICGATSTPMWLMEEIVKQIKFLLVK